MPDTDISTEAETVAETIEEQAVAAAKAAAEAVEAAARDAEQIDSVEDRLIDTVTASQQEAIETMESAGQALFEIVSRTQAEISEFVAERVRQDLDAQQALLRCRNLDEFREVQMKFVRTALNQYGGEAAKLVRISGEVAVKSLERVRA